MAAWPVGAQGPQTDPGGRRSRRPGGDQRHTRTRRDHVRDGPPVRGHACLCGSEPGLGTGGDGDVTPVSRRPVDPRLLRRVVRAQGTGGGEPVVRGQGQVRQVDAHLWRERGRSPGHGRGGHARCFGRGPDGPEPLRCAQDAELAQIPSVIPTEVPSGLPRRKGRCSSRRTRRSGEIPHHPHRSLGAAFSLAGLPTTSHTVPSGAPSAGPSVPTAWRLLFGEAACDTSRTPSAPSRPRSSKEGPRRALDEARHGLPGVSGAGGVVTLDSGLDPAVGAVGGEEDLVRVVQTER